MKLTTVDSTMTIREIFYVMHVGKVENNAKVSLHKMYGELFLCIHKGRFDTIEGALNYLREDNRNILAPELRPAYFKKLNMIPEMKKAEAELMELAEAA